MYGGPAGKAIEDDLKDWEDMPKLTSNSASRNQSDYFVDFFSETSASEYNHR